MRIVLNWWPETLPNEPRRVKLMIDTDDGRRVARLVSADERGFVAAADFSHAMRALWEELEPAQMVKERGFV